MTILEFGLVNHTWQNVVPLCKKGKFSFNKEPLIPELFNFAPREITNLQGRGTPRRNPKSFNRSIGYVDMDLTLRRGRRKTTEGSENENSALPYNLLLN